MQVVNVLRSLLTQLDEVKREREGLEGEIKVATFDMTANFLAAMEQDRSINEEALSLSQLDQQYGQYNQKVQATLRTQEELLGKVQVRAQRNARSGTVFGMKRSVRGWRGWENDGIFNADRHAHTHTQTHTRTQTHTHTHTQTHRQTPL